MGYNALSTSNCSRGKLSKSFMLLITQDKRGITINLFTTGSTCFATKGPILIYSPLSPPAVISLWKFTVNDSHFSFADDYNNHKHVVAFATFAGKNLDVFLCLKIYFFLQSLHYVHLSGNL